jgi:hypothetical protein
MTEIVVIINVDRTFIKGALPYTVILSEGCAVGCASEESPLWKEIPFERKSVSHLCTL